jgi:hypothetical protein
MRSLQSNKPGGAGLANRWRRHDLPRVRKGAWMSYVPCLVYDLDGNFVGYSILNNEARKLKTTNLWTDEERAKLDEQVARLNGHQALSAHWPRLDDPEVIALLSDPSFMPLETEVADVVDDEHSYYVWTEVPEIDHAGQPTGRMVKGELDRQASVIAYKKATVPKRPIDAQIRTKKAQEIVAQKRAGR